MLLCSDETLPRACILPKMKDIDKLDCLFRIIVCSINNPLYSLAVFLHKIIVNTIPLKLIAMKNMKNSFRLVNKLNDIHLNDDYFLIRLCSLQQSD